MEELIINPKEDLIFDYKVIEQCKSCKRYGKKATCPPNISSTYIYQKLLPSYKYCKFFYYKFDIEDFDNWKIDGRNSSIKLANYVRGRRDELVQQGHYFCIAFGAGSCKVCDSCSFPCRYPDKALIPLEATGLHIIEILDKFGIKLEVPIKETFYRVGAVFYD